MLCASSAYPVLHDVLNDCILEWVPLTVLCALRLSRTPMWRQTLWLGWISTLRIVRCSIHVAELNWISEQKRTLQFKWDAANPFNAFISTQCFMFCRRSQVHFHQHNINTQSSHTHKAGLLLEGLSGVDTNQFSLKILSDFYYVIYEDILLNLWHPCLWEKEIYELENSVLYLTIFWPMCSKWTILGDKQNKRHNFYKSSLNAFPCWNYRNAFFFW